MRIYLFFDERTMTLFHFPWFKKEPPIIVEAKVRRSGDGSKEEESEDGEKPS
jgi:hypothetical protein